MPACNLIIMARARAGDRLCYVWHIWRKSNSALPWFSIETHPLTTGCQICLCFQNSCENMRYFGWQGARPACNLVTRPQAWACGRRRYVWHVWGKSNSVLCWFSIKTYPLTTGGQICLCFRNPFENMGSFGWQEAKVACNPLIRAQARAGSMCVMFDMFGVKVIAFCVGFQ